MERLDVPWVALLSMDSFYKALTPEQLEAAHRNEYNFDSPGRRHRRWCLTRYERS